MASGDVNAQDYHALFAILDDPGTEGDVMSVLPVMFTYVGIIVGIRQ